MNIVFIDDSPLIVDKLSQLVAELPWCTILGSAADVASALTLIERTMPDVAIIDLHLIGGSGLTVLRYCKAHYPSVMTVILTADVHPMYRTLCLELGADRFVDKNTEFERLTEILTGLCPLKEETAC